MDIDALRRQLQERAGLSPEQAEQAARVALEFVREHADQLVDIAENIPGADRITRRLGGLFGRD